MEKMTAVQMQQAMLGKIEQQQEVASNPFSNQAVAGNMLRGITHDNLAVNPVSDSSLAFSNTLKSVLDTVDRYQSHAAEKITAVELGKSDDLLGATVASQKAQLSFNALMQVRNKMVSNFQDIIKMPI
ncbi:Flagellar hook-basal body complex protein FliE [Vibrio chagasii]|uniref:flagellar hook-basal body complex protein FliE n=1 Tax=Vibrio chagasii TaxID=170679 RepID=UPI00338B7C65|nr:Flagellar hook-basal body complex protein FliE [Vibrio chagasii]CAH6827112.1 Flagellar hook-basal body complex protein FliE [Vibrio chagasii]CAH6831077.1 Flagellar hook-basal body complex protein FliE [Vibrio chagasii]CAH7001569.1 Flagellar hook-basal body complex protein FliE [Vibrio chagasii]CAH7058133.1 Flagellar hook-basal body complex protein FliE [Vibrio chagasii]